MITYHCDYIVGNVIINGDLKLPSKLLENAVNELSKLPEL